MSRSSCASNTDSSCSTLSLTSSSTVKLENGLTSRCSNDGNRWIKCDSFEELPLQESPPEKVMHKVCISTFVDKHVRTASVYDAITFKNDAKPTSFSSSSSNLNLQCTPKYVACSGTSVGINKRTDVRRTPSLNVCNISSSVSCNSVNKTSNSFLAQKHNRQYTANAQSHVSSHGRTATRIGISSLSRDQRLPLTLYNNRGILACGSEPNLYVPVNDCTSVSLAENSVQTSQWLQKSLNSRSEMCLNVMDSQTPVYKTTVLPSHEQCEPRPRHLSLPDVCCDVVDGEFPCIPPPPAYRNEINGQNIPLQPPTQLQFSSNEKVRRLLLLYFYHDVC